MDPVRDWLMLLMIGVTILAGIIGWNVWTFDTAVSGTTVEQTATSTGAVFNQSTLDTVRSIFNNRSEELAKYVSGEYTYTDPASQVLKKNP